MSLLHIFVHIPKTGGTSLRNHFQTHLVDKQTFVHFADKGDNENIKESLPIFEKYSHEDKLKVQVILGHNLTEDFVNSLPHEQKRMHVIFREPKDWIISKYNQSLHDRSKNNKSPISFEDWFNDGNYPQSQFNWLARNYFGDSQFNAKCVSEKIEFLNNKLQTFSIVTCIKKLDTSFQSVFKEINIPTNIERKNVSLIRKKEFYQSTFTNENLIKKYSLVENKIFNKIKFFIFDRK